MKLSVLTEVEASGCGDAEGRDLNHWPGCGEGASRTGGGGEVGHSPSPPQP